MSKVSEKLEQQADLLFRNVSGWESNALRRIGRRVKSIKSLSYADLKAINNAAVVKHDVKAILNELAALSGQNAKDVHRIYRDMIKEQHLENKPLYDYCGKNFMPLEDNKQLQAIVRAYARTTTGTMTGLTMSKAKDIGFIDKNNRFISLEKNYKRVLDKATVSIATGTGDFNSEMREALKELGGSGLRVNYGGGVTRRLDSMVRQNLLWGAKQASAEYNEMLGEELGCDGIEIDWHSNPRPSHEFMQGKMYSLHGTKTVKGITYEGADKALEALSDYGCLHFKTPVILGVSEPRYSEEELEQLNAGNKKQIEIDGAFKTGYEWKQAMRRLELEARKTHNQIEILKASGDKTGVKQLHSKLSIIEDRYNRIASGTGIKAQPQRMAVVNGKSIDKSAKSGIMKVEQEFSPRKTINGNFSVDWSKIQDRTYNERLHAISNDDKVVNAIETRCKWALNNRNLSKTEELYAINLNDGSEVSKIIDQHNDFGVKRTPKFNAKLKQADDAGQKVLLIHNHPRGLPPSVGDINGLLENGNVSGITAGHNGSIYYYTKPQKEILEDDWNIAMKHFKRYSEVTAMEKSLEILSKKYGFEIIKL